MERAQSAIFPWCAEVPCQIWKLEPAVETYVISVVIPRDSNNLAASYIVGALHSMDVSMEMLLNRYFVLMMDRKSPSPFCWILCLDFVRTSCYWTFLWEIFLNDSHSRHFSKLPIRSGNMYWCPSDHPQFSIRLFWGLQAIIDSLWVNMRCKLDLE